MADVVKPPLGLMPKWLHERTTNINRHNAIVAAMYRYQDAGKEIPQEWIDELEELRPMIKSYNLPEVDYYGQE